ncbi:CpaF family protein [Caenimonas sedimenti]|uniref:CpaF family protein n=2 Tax=Caenimonas sedimenti TaxID=2596921 RepID=A0A562ZT52_9BURK|nr:CpaF family protein [Caenimonas sedimenti]
MTSSMAITPSALPTAQRIGFKQQVLAQLKDTLHALRPMLEDEDVNEIMVNAPNEVFISKAGREFRVAVKLNAGEISAAITLIATLVAREVGEKSGQRTLSGRLPGFRVEAILPPVAVNGPSMCIRRHASRILTLDEYIGKGVISERHAQEFADTMSGTKNFLIVGGTGSGKTTLMNTALALMPREDRLFVIETVHELQLQNENHVVVECDEDYGVSPRRAVRTAMRYAPKRIIVGELRGPEAYDWKDAANTGHPGSGATIHANSAKQALPRLENLLLMADMGVPYDPLRASIAETVQVMFFIERQGAQRTVSQVSRLHGYDRQRGTYEIEAV